MQRMWLRRVGAVIGGIVIAGLCIAVLEAIAHQLLSGEAAFAAAAGALLVGGVLGGIFAKRLSKSNLCAWIVIGALALLSAMNMLSFTHPDWFGAAAIAALALGGWLTTRLTPAGDTAS